MVHLVDEFIEFIRQKKIVFIFQSDKTSQISFPSNFLTFSNNPLLMSLVSFPDDQILLDSIGIETIFCKIYIFQFNDKLIVSMGFWSLPEIHWVLLLIMLVVGQIEYPLTINRISLQSFPRDILVLLSRNFVPGLYLKIFANCVTKCMRLVHCWVAFYLVWVTRSEACQ